MTKITLSDLANLENQTTAVSAINANNAAIETAFDNTLSRDGTSPNQMSASLDMNSHRILNLPSPTSLYEPIRLLDVETINSSGITVSPLPAGGLQGQHLIKNTDTNYDVSWAPPASSEYGQVFLGDGTGVTDVTAQLNTVLAGNSNVLIKPGTYKINGTVSLNDNQTIVLSSGTILKQYAANPASTPIFQAIGKNNITIIGNGAVFYGEGTFCGNVGQAATVSCPIITASPTAPIGQGQWLGQVSADIAIRLITCTNVHIDGVHTKNCGGSGIAIYGGNTISITNSVIEGTNLYSTPIHPPSATPGYQANFQNGLFLNDQPTYGVIENLKVVNCDISGTAQGVLVETYPGVNITNRSIEFNGMNIHDITGQHGFYIDSGKVSITNATLSNLAEAGVKVQIGDSAMASIGVSAVGIVAENLGGNMFEIGVFQDTFPGASLSGVQLQGVGKNVNRGLSIGGLVKNLQANIVVTDTVGEGLVIQGNLPSNMDIKILAERTGEDGVLITSTNSNNIKIQPTIINPSTNSGSRYGIIVASASANVSLFDPVVTDANSKMFNGLYNSVSGGTIAVYGSAKFTGATDWAVVTTGHIVAWPIWATVQGTAGSYKSPVNFDPVNLGAATQPFTNLFLGPTGSVNFGNNDVQIQDTTDQLTFTGAGNGYQFDGPLLPTTNRLTQLGVPSRGWFGVYLDGATSGTSLLVAPAIAGGLTHNLPVTSDTLVGKATTDTLTNKTYDTAGTGNSFSINGLAATANTGTGSVVRATSPTLVTPALGTPTSGVATNLTGTASGLTAGNVTTNANLTGPITSVGNATSIASQTGTGTKFVMDTSPALVTPNLGTPSAVVLTNATGTAASLTAGTVTTNANLTGDVTSVGNATTLTNAPVIAKVLTGYTSGAGTVSAADSILSAIQKLNGNDATNANLTGDVTSIGNATTLTNAPVIAKVLTGYTSGAGTVSAADSILTAIQKLNGNDATNANLTGVVTSVGNATSLGSFTSANLATALTDETGSGANVFGTSPQITTPDIVGTTAAGNANAGSVGEFVSAVLASGSAVSLATSTAKTVTSISLTAGDWDVSGQLSVTGAGTTTFTDMIGGINTTTDTLPSAADWAVSKYPSTTVFSTGGSSVQMVVPNKRINVSSTTTVYLIANCTFGTSTCSAYGKIEARRRR